jgi:hypothetical protein
MICFIKKNILSKDTVCALNIRESEVSVGKFNSRFLRNNNSPQGVMMGNEHYHMQEHAMTLENVNVINNMIKGFQINVGFWYNGFES